MEYYDRITKMIFDAVRELNAPAGLGRELEISADTVLAGAKGTLDSLKFVNLVMTLEDEIERDIHKPVSVMDILFTAEPVEWTAAGMASCICRALEPEGHEDARGATARG